MARAAKKKSYVAQYTISPAKHASDTIFVCSFHPLLFIGPPIHSPYPIHGLTPRKWNQPNPIQTTNPLIYKGFTGSFASFFQTGDPNAPTLTSTSIPGVPENWRTGKEFVIGSEGFESGGTEELGLRCGFWRQLADQVPI
jgi:hypothetical protein